MLNTNISALNGSILQFKKNGDEILQKSKATLINAGVHIPIGKSSEKRTDEPVKGLEVEHEEDKSEVKDSINSLKNNKRQDPRNSQ